GGPGRARPAAGSTPGAAAAAPRGGGRARGGRPSRSMRSSRRSSEVSTVSCRFTGISFSVPQRAMHQRLTRPPSGSTPWHDGRQRDIVRVMPRLKTSKRSRLPDRAFAYIDSRGRRRLPVHDKAHVRNALARFNQVAFEDDADRERARTRLLNAAKKYGIVPVGFITGQLQSERKHATAGRLVIELGRHGAPGELEQRLRNVLRDPTLAVLHWSEAPGAYLDGSGKPVPLPAEDDQRSVTYLERQGRPMTALVHDKAVLDDPDLAETVLAAVRFVVEKERGHGQIQA